MIIKDKKIIFLHIPKTGGTSIMKSLRPHGLEGSGHMQLSRIFQKYNINSKNRNDYLVFTVSRNPWDLVVSNFAYIKMKKSYWHSSDGSTKYGEHPDYNTVKNMNFKEFVYALKDKKIKSTYNTLPQSYWIDRKVDYIIRFENMSKDFETLCKKVGLPNIELLHLNKSKHQDYKKYYDKELISIVEKLYAKDIKMFNYRFNNEKN